MFILALGPQASPGNPKTIPPSQGDRGEYLQNHFQSCWWFTDFFPPKSPKYQFTFCFIGVLASCSPVDWSRVSLPVWSSGQMHCGVWRSLLEPCVRVPVFSSAESAALDLCRCKTDSPAPKHHSSISHCDLEMISPNCLQLVWPGRGTTASECS